MDQADASQGLFESATYIASKRGLLKAGIVASSEKSRCANHAYALVDTNGRLILRASIEELSRVASNIASRQNIVRQANDAIGKAGCAVFLILACLAFPPLAIIIIFAVWPWQTERTARARPKHQYLGATFKQYPPHSATQEESLVSEGEAPYSLEEASLGASKENTAQIINAEPEHPANNFSDATAEAHQILEDPSLGSTSEITYAGSSGYGTWVSSSYRRGTYVSGYINKRGKWVSDFFEAVALSAHTGAGGGAGSHSRRCCS
jgi:hypothetical protein